jgi:tripartite-type tricarboxylate transporter receptor subunit TctC
MLIKKFAQLALALLVGATASIAPAQTAEWPTRPITLLVPFSAGGTVDIVARLLGPKISEELGQNIIIDNRTGAGGTIATGMLANAKPDGYTLMAHHMGLAFNAALYENLPFDTVRDVLPVAYIGATPNVLVTTNSFSAKSLKEFIKLAKSKPGEVSYGSGGVGSAGHLPMAVLEARAGIKLIHVPYRGAAPAMTDLMSGQIHTMLQTIPAVMLHIQSGKVQAIATSGRVRSPALPNLPTFDEAGIKGFDYAPWYGLFAPQGTPAPIVKKLHAAVNHALNDPVIIAKLAQQGLDLQKMSREKFADIVSSDIAEWSKTIKTLNLRVE